MSSEKLPYRVKFCGLRSEADVDIACGLGVWAVGFVLTESCRRIELDTCARLARQVPAGILKFGVVATESPEYIAQCVDVCGLDAVQVHAEHTADEWATYASLPIIRAVRVASRASLCALEDVRGGRFLLDAAVAGQVGGTGVAFDWTLAREAAAYGEVILAGGLTSENVAEAIRVAQPFALDVSSGLESARGVKSPERMQAFADAVRRAVGLS